MDFITNKNGFLTQEKNRVGVSLHGELFFFFLLRKVKTNHSISKEKSLIWKHALSIRDTERLYRINTEHDNCEGMIY